MALKNEHILDDNAYVNRIDGRWVYVRYRVDGHLRTKVLDSCHSKEVKGTVDKGTRGILVVGMPGFEASATIAFFTMAYIKHTECPIDTIQNFI